jgi:hypothetical protein
MRYVSAERSIAAAGAAFACAEDEGRVAGRPPATGAGRVLGRIRSALWRAFLVMGLIIF